MVGPVAATEEKKGKDGSSSTGDAHNLPSIDIRIARAKHVQIRLPKRADRVHYNAALGAKVAWCRSYYPKARAWPSINQY